MRQQSIEHVGQVKTAILETTGNISFYYFTDDEVIYGLPILPHVYEKKLQVIEHPDHYSCTYCGHSLFLEIGTHRCGRCNRDEWVKAVKTLRLT